MYCDQCTLNIDDSLNELNKYLSILINRINSSYMNMNLQRESALNLDFIHSQMYFSIEKSMIPISSRNLLKSILVSLFLIFEKS